MCYNNKNDIVDNCNFCRRNDVDTENISKPCILVVDDEPDIRVLLKIVLEREGYRVKEAQNGIEAVESVKELKDVLSLIILDIMMPGLDGIGAAGQIRDITDAPILFLTARSSDNDKTEAYSHGGDDYIVKPFHATDLVLKVGALTKRYDMYRASGSSVLGNTAKESLDNVWERGDVVYIPSEKKVLKGGEEIPLTDREYELFVCLAEHSGESLSPAQLYEKVWGEQYLSTASNTVIVHIANLRRKLEKDPAKPQLIRTVWGKGYRID